MWLPYFDEFPSFYHNKRILLKAYACESCVEGEVVCNATHLLVLFNPVLFCSLLSESDVIPYMLKNHLLTYHNSNGGQVEDIGRVLFGVYGNFLLLYGT